ncbi:MAG: BamA/TamA family outer membrane protein [Bacteroidales bacterium]|nr:BamA/TamA family outer membrane protein [Bacteroidales bacterium]
MTGKIDHITLLIISTVLLFLTSCNATKYLAEDEYLLHKYKIEDKKSDIPREDYKNYIKQKPNKRVFGYKFWLNLYNLSGKNDDKWINRWLKSIGEPPAVYNPDLTDNSTQQLELFLFNKGYFDAEVTDSVEFIRRKAKVHYNIYPGERYTIRNVDYFFQDVSLSDYIVKDTASAVLQPGIDYDIEKFREENLRIESILRNKGYYNFSRNFIDYEVDSTVGDHKVDVFMRINNYPIVNENGRIIRTKHPVYRIRNVYLKTNENIAKSKKPNNEVAFDTVQFDSVYLINRPDVKIRSGIVTQKNYIIPGDLYNERKVQQTYRNLTSLSALRLVDINFMRVEDEQDLLDCRIDMLPAVRQAFTGGIEGTTSGGNIGAAGNLNYQHRNLFGGSEKFNLTFLGAIETLYKNPDANVSELGTMQELGVEAGLSFPRFLLPFKTDQFIRKFNPETDINLAYNFQRRPDYTRTTFRSSFGYRWRGNSFLTHAVYPLDISLINSALEKDFEDWLSGSYLYYSYLPHFIADQRYRLIYSTQKLNKSIDFNYLRFGVESAGNIMYGLFKTLGYTDSNPVLDIFGVDYAQYFRTELDLRHYDYIYEEVSLVYRAYIGAAIPYLNSAAIPFEKQFFGGGANSIRAWRVKSLGPGSYEGDTFSRFPNQTADLKLEVNFEYRFHLIWKLEGAIFLDAGNIWSLSREDDREGALFNFNKFYREIALGTGFGFRFDFNFFIFRVDVGVPLSDPSYPEGERWIPTNYNLDWNDLGLNIAIGYPF